MHKVTLQTFHTFVFFLDRPPQVTAVWKCQLSWQDACFRQCYPGSQDRKHLMTGTRGSTCFSIVCTIVIYTHTHTPNTFESFDSGVIFFGFSPPILPGLFMGGGASFTRAQTGACKHCNASSWVPRFSCRLGLLEHIGSTLGRTESSPSAASGN